MKRVVLLALILWAVPIKSQKTTTTPKEAVCIIGSHSIYTESSLEQMEHIATLLESKNYTVHRFYDPNNEWEAIKKRHSMLPFLSTEDTAHTWESMVGSVESWWMNLLVGRKFQPI